MVNPWRILADPCRGRSHPYALRKLPPGEDAVLRRTVFVTRKDYDPMKVSDLVSMTTIGLGTIYSVWPQGYRNFGSETPKGQYPRLA